MPPGLVRVRHDDLHPTLGARCHIGDPGAECDRARGSGRGQLHETKRVADLGIVVGMEPDLIDVEGSRPVDIGHGNKNELDLPVHAFSIRGGVRRDVAMNDGC